MNTTQFADTNEHRIFVTAYDTIGNTASSDTVVVYFDQSRGYPPLVEITTIEYDSILMHINWQKSLINDFRHYLLSAVDSIGGDTIVIDEVTTIDTPLVNINEFNPSNPRWYWVTVVDTFGFSAAGQLTKVLDAPPIPSRFLYIKHEDQSFHLIWTRNRERDFAQYVLYGNSLDDTTGRTELWASNDVNDTTFVEENISWGAHRIYTLVTRDFWGLESSDSISGAAITQVLFFGDRYGLSDQLDIFSLDLTYNEETYYQRESTGSILRLMLEEKAFYLMDNPIRGQRTVDTGIIDPAVMWIESLAANPFDTTNSLKFDMAKKYHDVLNKTDGIPSSRLGYPMHFSPDGKTLFFTDNELGDPNLVMMDMDSGDVSILSEIFTDLWFDMNTAADTLVFVKKIGYGTAIYSLPLDSGAAAIRLSYETEPRNPVFSVDGSLVVYTARDRFGSKNLYTIRPDGSAYKKITRFSDPADAVVPVGITAVEPSILYVMDSQNTKNQLEIWSITLDGSSDQFLTVCTLEADDRPRISPNGKKVLYQRDHNLWIMNIDGSGQARLTDLPIGHLAYHGQWSPSGLTERHNIVLSGNEIEPNNNFRFWPVFQP